MKQKLVMLLTFSMVLLLIACSNSEKNSDKESDVTKSFNYTEENSDIVETTDKVSEEVNNNVNDSNETTESNKPVENGGQNSQLTVDGDYANLPESEGFEFESNGDGTCTLRKISKCNDTDIVIPEKSPEGDIVTKIAELAFYGVEDINSIIFVGRTMELDKKAFQSCEAKKIVISGCDLVIGENAFAYCENINELDISNSTLEIGEYAFYDAGKDMKIKVSGCSGELGEKAFQSCCVEELIISASNLELGENVFSYCEELASVAIDSCTLEIGSYAFYDACDEATVTFTDCSLNMDDNSFQSCGVATLNISGSDTVMGGNTFAYCEDLTEVMIGANNTEIGAYCFYDCTALANVSIAANSKDDSLELVIADNAFQSCSVQNVVIGSGKVEIGDNAFAYCEEIISVEINGTLSKLGNYVFYDCPDKLVINYKGVAYDKESIEDVE